MDVNGGGERAEPQVARGANQPKVLFLTASDLIGGMERCIVNLSRELPARGWGVETVFRQTPQSAALLAWCRHQGVAAQTSRAVLGYDDPRPPRAMLALRRFVSESKATVVHLHYGANYLSLKDVLAARLA